MNLAKTMYKNQIMKKVRLLVVLLLAIFIVISCKPNQNLNVNDQNIHRKWMLVEYKDFTKQELTNLGANMDLTKNSDAPNRYTAKMGCNGMFFTAEFNQGKAKFSGVGSTMMYCDGKMKLEELFGKDLTLMNRYKIEGHFLTLTDGTTSMKFIAADWD